jgi:hypothetical protein
MIVECFYVYLWEVEHKKHMMNELPQRLEEIMACIEAISSQIESSGNEEQKLLVRAMYDSLSNAAPQYESIPDNNDERFMLWRHNTIGPLGLCINSAELLLTDIELPLTEGPRRYVQTIYDTALALNRIINAIAEQRNAI